MSKRITVTYDSDWSDLTTEEKELKEYGITLLEQKDPGVYECHEITIMGTLESLWSWINNTQDTNLQDTLRDLFDEEIKEEIDFIKEKFEEFKTKHPSLRGKELINKFRDHIEKTTTVQEIASESYVNDNCDPIGVCVHYLMYCNDIEVYYNYETNEIEDEE